MTDDLLAGVAATDVGAHRHYEITPKIQKAIEEAQAQWDRAIDVRCAWGTCYHVYDPVDKITFGGWGDPFCGCDNLPGWRSRHPEGLPKPSVPVKAKGRHGSRVQRSRARRRGWQEMLKEYHREMDAFDRAFASSARLQQTPEAINQ